MSRTLTMNEVRKRNREAGHYWFTPDTMRFFNSRVETSLIGGSAMFVTSERMELDMPKRYTIREALPDGSIETVGDFQAYESRAAAVAAIRELIANA